MTSTASSSRRSAPVEGIPHTPDEVVRALREVGVSPSRRLGQSFLVDPFVADAEASLVGPGVRVLEIGGGLGILTEALLRRGVGRLTVLERDRRLASWLRRRFGDSVDVLEGDALEVDWPPADAVAGNLPFSVATPILERVWEQRTPRFVGMLQREVAERLAAGPGSKSYGRLSILAALYGTVELFQPVPSGSFWPEPAVEGRVFTFARRTGPLPVSSPFRLEALLHALFSARRKQLGNLVGRALPPGTDAESVARSAGWPSDWRRRRPEELPPAAFFALAEWMTQSAPGGHRARPSS